MYVTLNPLEKRQGCNTYLKWCFERFPKFYPSCWIYFDFVICGNVFMLAAGFIFSFYCGFILHVSPLHVT